MIPAIVIWKAVELLTGDGEKNRKLSLSIRNFAVSGS
jgi:hypothetical protein